MTFSSNVYFIICFFNLYNFNTQVQYNTTKYVIVGDDSAPYFFYIIPQTGVITVNGGIVADNTNEYKVRF